MKSVSVWPKVYEEMLQQHGEAFERLYPQGYRPLVTGTLITRGKTPRYVIGSVSLSEFFITLASALTFFTVLGIQYWQITLGLLLGGIIAAPIAARLVGKLPRRTMFIGIGAIIMIWSMMVFFKLLINT